MADAHETNVSRLCDDAQRSFASRVLRAPTPGAAAARNHGLVAARAPLVLFLDNDVLPERELVEEHLAWHRRYPEPAVGVLGRVRWADELTVTPFMRWLDRGIQFDFKAINGIEAGWGRLYTANVSLKRTFVCDAGGFNETDLPFGHEDLDLGFRLHQRGLRLLYNRSAVAEHLHPMDLAFWKKRVARIAVSERRFSELHPELPPYFYSLFSSALAVPLARGRGVRFGRLIPPWFPVIGPRVWDSIDSLYRQELAIPFLAAWHEVPGAPELRQLRRDDLALGETPA